jgi:hypothetical protein
MRVAAKIGRNLFVFGMFFGFMQFEFTSNDSHIVGSFDANGDTITRHAMHHHADVPANHQRFAYLATQN